MRFLFSFWNQFQSSLFLSSSRRFFFLETLKRRKNSPSSPRPAPPRLQKQKTKTKRAASNPYITAGSLPPFGAHGRDFDLFWQALEHHWSVELPAAGAPPPADYGTSKFGVPTVCSDRLNLASLYREVCLRGGHAAVGEAKWWKRVGRALAGVEAATRSTALGTVLKYAYEKW